MFTTNNSIEKLRAMEVKLRSPQVRAFVEKQSPEFRQNFDKKRKEVGSQLKALENQQYEEILKRLDSLKPEYDKAFKDLDREIESLNNAVKIVSSINAVTRVLSKLILI